MCDGSLSLELLVDGRYRREGGVLDVVFPEIGGEGQRCFGAGLGRVGVFGVVVVLGLSANVRVKG